MKKYLISIMLSMVFLAGIVSYQYMYFYDGKLHVVFCDVGQGDAIFIKTPTNRYVMIDGGPDKGVLSCLSNHMPFWERRLDLVVLTHPHFDHFAGLLDVMDRYIALSFATERLSNKIQSYNGLEKIIAEKKIAYRNVFEGDRYKLGPELLISVEAPSVAYLKRSSPNGVIGESGELASLILKLKYKDFDMLLTGDAQTDALREVVYQNQDSIEVLQVAHHGSRTGISKEIVEFIFPKLAVISVGAKNRYGHPSKEVLITLKEAGVRTLRTDMSGDIEVVSDGERWWVR